MSILSMIENLESEYTIYSDDSLTFTLRLEIIKEFRKDLKEFFRLVLQVREHLQFIEDRCDLTYLGRSEYIKKYVFDFSSVAGSCRGFSHSGCDLIEWTEALFGLRYFEEDFEEDFERAFPISDIEIVEKELSTNYLVDKILADKELALYLLKEAENFNK